MAVTKEINIVVKETGLDEVNKKVNKLENSVESLEDQQRSLSKSMGDSSQSVLDNGGAMGLLNDATGGLAMTVKDAVEASWLFTKSQKAAAIQQSIATTVVGTSTGAMKAFRIALASTGIGLIVIGLGLLIANFDKVKKVVLNLVPGLAVIGAIFTKLVETVTDFVGVTSDASRELDRLGAEAEKTLAKNKFALDAYGDKYDEYTKRKMEANNTFAQHALDIKNSEVLTEKQKIEQLKALRERANRDILKAEDDRQKDLAKKRKDADDKAKAEAQKKADEAKKAKEDAIKAEDEEQKKREEKVKEDAQKSYEIDQEAKEAVASFTEFKNAEIEKREDAEIAAGETKMTRIQTEYDAEKKAAEERIMNEQLVRDAKFQIANSVFDMVNMFAKKGSKLAKGVAAAQATMNTYQGITAALAAPSTIPEPFGQAVRIANAATIGVMGLMNVKRILSTNEQGSSSGGGSYSGGGGSAPQAPSFNLVQGTGSNQIASSINTQQPIEAFVVSKNVSTGQELDRNIIKSASI